MFYKIFFLFFISSLSLGAQADLIQYKKVMMGEDSVIIKIQNPFSLGQIFVHVHENEVAALTATEQLLPEVGGKLITLIHSFDGTKNRNITFKYKGSTFQIDPNRIYTDDENVLIKTISIVKGNGEVDEEVIKIVTNLAEAIWNEMKNYNFIIAVHNNKNEPVQLVKSGWFKKKIEPASFSILSYVKQNDYSSSSNRSCSDIYINPEINNSEFFIVNRKQDFEKLVQKRYTVVLQNEKPIDDGSLSVYSSKFNKRYVNAEAKMGRVEAQKQMLSLLMSF